MCSDLKAPSFRPKKSTAEAVIGSSMMSFAVIVCPDQMALHFFPSCHRVKGPLIHVLFHSNRGSSVKERKREKVLENDRERRQRKKKYPSGVKIAMTNAKIGSGIMCLKSTCPAKTPAPTVKRIKNPAQSFSFFLFFFFITYILITL
jgi:hypothetical protein